VRKNMERGEQQTDPPK